LSVGLQSKIEIQKSKMPNATHGISFARIFSWVARNDGIKNPAAAAKLLYVRRPFQVAR
jgi:hypothetical protein